jgi:phytoene/squalene synthetase
MAQTLEFQQAHLDQVSRSFAFCIRRLPQPLGRWVGLTYLICRILDTVEDTQWDDLNKQNEMFELFEAAIAHEDACERLRGWEKSFGSLPPGEWDVLRDAHLILRDLHELPDSVRHSIRDLVLSMASGMQHFLKENKKGNAFRLSSLGEVNQYCFFVAGLVGEALTNLVSSVEPKFQASVANLLRAHHFGLFLQKVNILKDQSKDEGEGRLLVPSREQVERSASSDAREALEFLCSIPENQVEFRQFCGWSLFLGLETLIFSRASFLKRIAMKISRPQTEKLLAHVDDMIRDNQRLKAFFFEQAQRLNWDFSAVPAVQTTSPEWLSRLYRGRLDGRSLSKLGL